MPTSVPASTYNAAFAPQPVNGRLVNSSLQGLDLANGMTAGYGVQDGHVDNPPADPRIYGGNPRWAPKRVGVMRNVPGTAGGNIRKQYSLYFIFNPNEIVASFTTNVSQIPGNYLYGPSQLNTATVDGGLQGDYQGTGISVPNVANSQTVSWSLIFDRTYELTYGPDTGNNRGVLTDVAALYNLMGTFESQGAVPLSTPVQVAFAQNSAGQLWGFTGFITSVTITYGIFRHDMIPARCEVDLQMTTSYVSSQTPAVAGSGSTGGSSGGYSLNNYKGNYVNPFNKGSSQGPPLSSYNPNTLNPFKG